ncbi:hypothetical protein Tco_0409461 [Tanacetum coccineum]
MEESLTKFMAESAKRHEENSNIIKEIRTFTDATIRNQGASIKTLEIQIGQISKVFMVHTPYWAHNTGAYFLETTPFPKRLQNFGCDDWREVQDVKILEAYDYTLPQKEKDPGSFTFDKALVDLGESVSVISFSTYTSVGLGILSHTRIGKFVFPIDFIILDIPGDDDVPLILRRPFLLTAHSKIDVFKRKITLWVREEKLVFKSIKPATSIIKRVFVIKSLDSKTELIREDDESFDPTYGSYIELNDLDTPLEPETNQNDDFEPTFVKTHSHYYKMKFSCVIGYKYVNADLLPSLSINLMFKSFYYSIIKDKDEKKSHAETLIDIPVFVGNFSIITGFTIIDYDDITKEVVLGMKFCKKYASC